MHQLAWRCRVVLLLLTCLSAVVLTQTFQYSRGWTNGKRGPSPHGLWSADKDAPCQLRLFLGGRDTHQLYFPCEMFRHFPNEVSEHYRRKPILDVPTSPIENDATNEDEIQ